MGGSGGVTYTTRAQAELEDARVVLCCFRSKEVSFVGPSAPFVRADEDARLKAEAMATTNEVERGMLRGGFENEVADVVPSMVGRWSREGGTSTVGLNS